MRSFLVVVLLLLPTPNINLDHPCAGAKLAMVSAMAQERSTPPGEWCQREVKPMPAKAHACACHEHDCSDPDPNHVSAHVDPECLNFCTTSRCFCERMDCP